MVYGTDTLRFVGNLLGTLIFLFAMWFLSRYFTQKPKKGEEGKTDVINIGAWLFGLGGIVLGIIFLLIVVLLIIYMPQLTLLRFFLLMIGLGVALLFIWSGYSFTRMARGTWKRPQIPLKTKRNLNVSDIQIEKVKKKNAQLSWWWIIVSILASYLIKTSLLGVLCSNQINCILSVTLLKSSILLGIFFFVLAWFCKRYQAIGLFGNVHLLTEQKAQQWWIIYIILGIFSILGGIAALFLL